MPGFKNYEQWKKEIELMGSVTAQTIRDVLPEAGIFARDAIRQRIPPGASGGAFPGYAARGDLKNAITVSRVYGDANSPRVSVGLASGASDRIRMIAFVHEYGMTIYARRAKYMRFQVQGHWVRTKQVTITPKHFFEEGWAEAASAFPGLIDGAIRRRWAQLR